MKLRLLILVSAFTTTLLMSLTMLGQSDQHYFQCGQDIFAKKLSSWPDLQGAIQQTLTNASTAAQTRSNEELTVRVVVHIVWKEEEENLDDSLVYDQIRILNEDFNRTNADTGNLRSLFQPAAGKANIRFELAGIQRIQTNALFTVDLLGTNLLAEVKHTADGGSDAWATEHYLNIWVCKIQPIEIFGLEVGQVLGFAFPPAGLAHWPKEVSAPSPEEDGVVIDYRTFGSNNPYPINDPVTMEPLTIRGRTPVHEVGHYLGLRHIWGDGGLFGPNDCAQSDGVQDTPFANAQSAFDCDTNRNTCNHVELYYGEDVPDLIENYMDYSSETCMNMFTRGQVEIMRNVLTGPRSGLLEPVSSVSITDESTFMILSPNPATDIIRIPVSTPAQFTGYYRVFDMQGRILLQSKVVDLTPDANHFTLDISSLSGGMYTMVIQGNEKVQHASFIKI